MGRARRPAGPERPGGPGRTMDYPSQSSLTGRPPFPSMGRLMPALPHPSRARLLIVEDDAAIRNAFRQALAGSHDVVTAGSCAEAERLMAERPAALLLLDYSLPDGTGLGLLARLARTWPEVRALLVSGDLEAAARDPDGARCPPVRRLAKPVSVAALRSAVDEALAGPPPG